ncbi:MAG TPA: type II toxin-antitoxin system Phd/YefM family antitoxin [Thermomicrobiales bacterium]|nr:type II toxin-antitoxin system Phd/YefM family antitoxin [Thermomicrobiales bacterium]
MTAKKAPVTETKTVSEARRTFSETLNRVYRGETRVVIEKNGIPVGAIVSSADVERLERMEARRAEQWAAVERMREAFADIPDDELEGEIEKAVAEVRAEHKRRDSDARGSAA